MSIYHQLQAIQYLVCQLPRHHEEMSMVCLEKGCSGNMLICPICELDSHQNHTTMPLKEFLIQNTQKSNDQIGKRLFQKLGELQETKKCVMDTFAAFRQKFLNQMYILQSKVSEYFNKIADKFIGINRLDSRQYISTLLKNQKGPKAAQNYNKLLRQIKFTSLSNVSDALNFFISTTNSRINSVNNFLNEFKCGQPLKMAQALFTNVQDPFMKPIYVWSALRSPKIQVEGQVATQTSSCSNGQRFALLQSKQPSFGEVSTSLKVRKLKGWIGVGICLKNMIVTAGYKFNYTIAFHGSYLISANGYSWSHSQPEFNSSQKSFSFHQGDIIKITYSNVNKSVVFRVLNKGNEFKLAVIDAPANDSYVPCVNMCNPGDEVEIINDSQ